MAGYDSEFGPASASSASSVGTFLIASSANLFQDASGSALALQQMMADTLQEAHTECQGVSFGEVAKLQGPTVGDESWASEASFTVASWERNPLGGPHHRRVPTGSGNRECRDCDLLAIRALLMKLVRLAKVLAERAK